MQTGAENLGETTPKRLNPWFSMWIKPRPTIQQIIATDPKHLVLLLAALGGLVQTLSQARMEHMGDSMGLPAILAIVVVAGSLGGVVGLYICSWLIGWTGKWLQGAASTQEIRAAMAWSSVPMLWVSLLWIPELAIFGVELFKMLNEVTRYSIPLSLMVFGFSVIKAIGGLWAFVLFFICLAQVQRFSIWRALANALLAGLVVAIPLIILALGFGMMAG